MLRKFVGPAVDEAREAVSKLSDVLMVLVGLAVSILAVTLATLIATHRG